MIARHHLPRVPLHRSGRLALPSLVQPPAQHFVQPRFHHAAEVLARTQHVILHVQVSALRQMRQAIQENQDKGQ